MTICLYLSEFFPLGVLSFSPDIYSLGHLFTLVWTHGYLFCTLRCNIVPHYFLLISPSFGHWKVLSSYFSASPFLKFIILFLQPILTFRALQDDPGSSYMFLLRLRINHFPKEPCFLSLLFQNQYLSTKCAYCYCSITIQGFISRQNKRIHICKLTHVYTNIYNYFCVYLSKYEQINTQMYPY